jgi:hypothetical protein
MFGPFETRKDKLAPMPVFLMRVLKSLLMAFCLIGIALLIGIFGYHWIASFDWIDSLLEASMILGGMGPIKELYTPSSKIFASIYALFSGVVFIGVMGFVLAPVAHRVLHKFHIDEQDVKKGKK